MDQAKKMILVAPEMLDRLQQKSTVKNTLTALDNEMDRITI